MRTVMGSSSPVAVRRAWGWMWVWVWACGSLAGCALAPADEPRLAGDTIALLGEVHDNAEGHRARLALLRRAVERGWRPAIAMEQFDTDQQAALDRARAEAAGGVPGGAADDAPAAALARARRLIERITPARSGWDWALYEPVVALALQYRLPLVAANLSAADTARIVRGGFEAVFTRAQIEALGLAQPPDAAWQAAQEREIDAGHCGMLPRTVWPAMARAQFARDAVMAQVLRAHPRGGVVLLAGNGHARRDLGVARWLTPAERARTLAVGHLERTPGETVSNPPAAAFDRVVPIAPAPREDPCAAFADRARPAPAGLSP